LIYLAQTDTTVGFLSQNESELKRIKPRDDKPFLLTTTTFKTLKSLTRVPKKFRRLVRKSKKTTFVYPNNKAIRVVKSTLHYNFLKDFDYLYSTSANKSGKSYDEHFAKNIADVIVEDKRGLYQDAPSNLFKLSSKLKKKLR